MGHMGHGFEILIWPKVVLKEMRTAVKWETKVEKRCEKIFILPKTTKCPVKPKWQILQRTVNGQENGLNWYTISIQCVLSLASDSSIQRQVFCSSVFSLTWGTSVPKPSKVVWVRKPNQILNVRQTLITSSVTQTHSLRLRGHKGQAAIFAELWVKMVAHVEVIVFVQDTLYQSTGGAKTKKLDYYKVNHWNTVCCLSECICTDC